MTIVPKMIDFYEEYFQIKYPLPKMGTLGRIYLTFLNLTLF